MRNLFVFKIDLSTYISKDINGVRFHLKFHLKKLIIIIFFFIFSKTNSQIIYQHDFGTTIITDKPFTVPPTIIDANLELSQWTTSVAGFAGYFGNGGNPSASLSLSNSSGTPTITLIFQVVQGFQLSISQFGFWRQRSSTGATDWSMVVNGIFMGSGTIPTTGNSTGNLNVSNTIAGLTGIITIEISLSGASGSGTFRLDDFTLIGAVVPIQTSYRSRQNGNWVSPSTWEYSTDNMNWNISTNFPSKNEENILIQPTHTVIVNSPVSLDQATIAGTLELQTGGVLEINDGEGDDIIISPGGVLQISCSDNYSTSIKQSGDAAINISTNGKIEIGDGTSFTGNGYENFATSLTNIWNDGAIYEYNSNGIFQVADLTYFPNSLSTDVPIFRVIKVNGTAAAGAGKDFHLYGVFEFTTNVSFSGAGGKYFRNGIKGSATLTQLNAGKFYLNNSNAVLDGASLNLVLSAVMDLAPQTIVPLGANVTISGANLNNNLAGNVFIINGTLDVSDQGIKNTNGKIILNGIFRTKNGGGFSGSGSSIVSGNIVVNSGSTIELNANGDQSLNARNDFSNLIFSGSGTKTPVGSFSPSGTVTIKDDAIFDCSGRNIGDGTTSGATSTNLTMTGNSRLIVSTYGPNPMMGGIYNLSGGVIEFKGNNGTPQNIRSKNYQNIEVTGKNVLMSDGNIGLNKNGTFTIKNGGVFSINDNTIIGTGDATQAVIVESGGLFKCGTNMGFNGAAITSIPIKSSSVNEDIKNIILQSGSTVEYTRNGDQPITNANGLVYQNLVISGSGNKMAPADDLIIKGDFSKTSSATFDHNNGTVIFNSANVQTYSSVSPQIIFNNLTNKNTSGLNINDSLSVFKQLMLDNNSVIKLNADISLLSSKIQTASIGQLGTNVEINYGLGRFIIERYINTNSNGGHPKSWQLISTSACGETIFDTWQEKGSKTISGYGTWITDKSGTGNGFDAISAAPSMKYFDEISNSFIGISGTYVNLESKNGYMIFIRGDRNATSINSPATPTVLRTRGKIYTRDFLPPASIVSPGKFQCVGNPYASVIDFSKINSSNIGSHYTAWDPTLGGDYGVGGYQTITAATNFKAVPGNTAIYNSTSDYRNIQSGQGFFVSNYTASPGSVSFTEECKINDNQHLVNRETDTKRTILFANLVSGGRIADGNAVAFDKNFSNKVDGEDAFKMNNARENFAIISAGETLAVEARNELKESDTIFYHLNNLAKQEYQLAFIPENFLPGFEGYLVDQYLKTKIPLSLADTTFLNFYVTAENASVMANRFYIIFKAAAPLAVSFLSINGCNKNGNVWLDWKVENENEKINYEVEYSIDGINFSKIGSVNSKTGFSNSYLFIHEESQKGNNFYRIKINKLNGEMEYAKVVKVFISEALPSIKVYPNPVKEGIIQLQFMNQPKGRYRFNLFNSFGQKMATEEIIYGGGNSFQTFRPKANFIQGIYNLEILKPDGTVNSLKVWK